MPALSGLAIGIIALASVVVLVLIVGFVVFCRIIKYDEKRREREAANEGKPVKVKRRKSKSSKRSSRNGSGLGSGPGLRGGGGSMVNNPPSGVPVRLGNGGDFGFWCVRQPFLVSTSILLITSIVGKI